MVRSVICSLLSCEVSMARLGRHRDEDRPGTPPLAWLRKRQRVGPERPKGGTPLMNEAMEVAGPDPATHHSALRTEFPGKGFEGLVFQQELNEVYLLLDFISGQPDKHLSDLDSKIVDLSNPNAKLSSIEVIKRVSGLRYPPAPPAAADAAFLLTTKDWLNSIAYPARGLTIAYTIMFIEGDGAGLRRFFRRLAAATSGRKLEQPAFSSRVQMAQQTFPGLIDSAARFRSVKDLFAWGAIISTVISAFLLWQVTYGVQLTSRLNDLERSRSEAAAGIYDQLTRERATGGTSSGNPTSTSQDGVEYLQEVCSTDSDPAHASPPTTQNADPASKPRDHQSSTVRQLCNSYVYQQALLDMTIKDVGAYRDGKLFKLYAEMLPVHAVCPAEGCTRASRGFSRQEDAESVAGVLVMMSNYMLPILFGLVGTIASLVRSIQDKATQSILAPRDRSLSLIRLPLGIMAGVGVGLFFNPSTISAQTGGSLGLLTLSASGIAFLAGYGAEGFFRMLDLLITRIFNFDKEGVSPKRPMP